MRDDTFLTSVREFGRRTLFRPYAVKLVCGDVFVVRHPEALSVADDGLVLLTTRTGGAHRFDATSVAEVYRLPDDVPLPPDPY